MFRARLRARLCRGKEGLHRAPTFVRHFGGYTHILLLFSSSTHYLLSTFSSTFVRNIKQQLQGSCARVRRIQNARRRNHLRMVRGGAQTHTRSAAAAARILRPGPQTEPNARASKQPYARGGCCGRGRYSAWVTQVTHRSGELENAGKRGPGGKRKSGHVADDLRLFGVTGDGKPPHSTLGHGTTPYKNGGCRFNVGKGRRECVQRQKKKTRKRRTRLRLAPGVM